MAKLIRLIAAISCVTAAASITPAIAQDDDDTDAALKRAERMMQRFDANGDGEVTLEEYLAGGLDRFGIADADGDGFVTKQELVNVAANPGEIRATAMLNRMDTDGDGKVSLAETKAFAEDRAERRFERADADGDGFITAEEAQAVVGDRRGRRGDRHAARRGGGDWAGHGRRDTGRRTANLSDEDRAERRTRRAERMAAHMLRLLDTDGDDRISKAEADSRRTTDFAQIDKNNDGKLVADEFAMRIESDHRGRRGRKHHFR